MILKKLNPYAAQGNTIQLASSESGCCPEEALKVCKYVISGSPSAFNVKSPVTGQLETVAISGYSLDTVRKINDLLEANGYIVDGSDAIAYTASTITLIGELSDSAGNNITLTGGTLTVSCVKVVACEYKMILPYEGPSVTFSFNGVAGTPIAYDYSGTPDPITSGEITTNFPGLLGQSIVADAESETVTVTVRHLTEHSLAANGADAIKCCCKPDFVSA